MPNAIAPGASVTDAVPVAESDTESGLLMALVAMVRVPAGCAPVVEGETFVTTVQVPPAGTVGVRQVDDGSIEYGVPVVTESEETVSGTVWLFVNVTVLSELTLPTTTFPKLMAVGDATDGTMPVALSATLCGELGALVVMVSELAGTAPAAVGLAVTEILQLAPDASVLPHVVDATAYSAGAVIETIVRLVASLLVSVNDLMGLVAPTVTFPKARDVVESVVAEIPFPDRLNDSGLFGALVATEIAPAADPVAVGENVTRILQELLAASELPQVVLEME